MLSCGGTFDFDNKAAKLEELNRELEDPKIWDNAERAQAIGKEKKLLEGIVVTLTGVSQQLVDARELYDLARGENDDDTLIALARGTDPLKPQLVDRLTSPFLLFAADFDAQGPGNGEVALQAYLHTLWATMQHDLTDIFGHCIGFDKVDSAESFCAYIKRCQIETTMPFNDYWADGLHPGAASLPLGPLKFTGVLTVLAIIVWLIALLLDGGLALFHHDGARTQQVAHIVAWGVVLIPALVAVTLLAVYILYRWVMRRGAPPFATAPNSDLPSILKALFVQQHFTRFAIEAQGLDDAALHARFGAFLGAVQPGSPTPTQAPGEVTATPVGWSS